MVVNLFSLNKLRNNKNFLYLLISLCLNLILHLFIAFIYYNPVDFVLQLETAKEIARGKLLYRDIGEIIIHGNIRLPRPQYPPFYLYSLALFIFIIGVDIFTWQMAKIILIIFNLFVGLLIYYLTIILCENNKNKEKLAILTLNWYLINPITLGIVFGGYHEGFMLFFVLMGFILFIKDKYIYSGGFFGLGLLVKPIVGIYMIPLLFWGFKTNEWRILQIWITAGLVFLVGSLPFLLIVPEIYLNDVFFIHANRPDPSMAFYNYFFQNISTTIIPFIIQAILILIILFFLVFKIKNPNKNVVIESILPFMSIFLVFNRILYPHYIPFIFPFLTMNLMIFSLKSSSQDRRKKLGLLLPLSLIYIGIIIWSILWSIEGYQSYLTNPIFALMSLSCCIGLLTLSIISIYYLYQRNRVKEENLRIIL